MLQHAFKIENAKKSYSSKIKFEDSLNKIENFNLIQKTFFKSTYLVYFDNKRRLFIDLDVNKKMKIEAVIYHVEELVANMIYSKRKTVQFIMFLS